MSADDDGIWMRAGRPVEQLDDPLPPRQPDPTGGAPEPAAAPSRWRRWRQRGWVRHGLFALLGLFVLTLAWLVVTAPLGRALEPLDDPAMLFISADGKPIARRGAIKEAPVDVTRLDPLTPAAFIAIEDRRFRSHWGIDPYAIGRALVANIRAGGVRQGGSTLTQQLAKTSFLSSDRSYRRKAQEVIIAFWLEAWLTKDEILSRYLSSVYFGDGVYGLRAAAHHYFNREPERLTLAQSAMLAGMMKAPSRLAPTRNLKASQARSRLVLQAMADTDAITLSRARATRSARPNVRPSAVPTGTYFADWVAPIAQKSFDSDYGEVRVPTTLDSRLQRIADRAIRQARIGGAQAALVAMRPDGAVVAMVGGTGYAKSPFNRATQAQRQPGSAFKLFTYLAAMRAGYTPQSMIEDRPVTIDGWTPANSDGTYRGAISLREAFARSSNAATVRLAEQVGRGNVLRAARDLGVGGNLPDNPAVSLGTAGVTLVDMTAAYAAIAAGRYPVRPHGLAPRDAPAERGMLDLLRGPDGARLEPRRDWAPMLDLLWAAANEGTGHRAALDAVPSFGKTGTTQNNRDAWFIGFAGNLVVGVWVGRDDDQSLGAITGGSAPASIWHRFMASAVAIDGGQRAAFPPGYRPPVPRRLPAPASPPAQPVEDVVREALDLVRSILND